MQSRPYSYLFSVSYFGARYKGWAPQPHQLTVQRRLERVFRHVLGHEDFSLIGVSRTDSGVSCLGGFLQIFLREERDIEGILPVMNVHLPDDIRLQSVKEVAPNFNLIQSVKKKTYRYYFSCSEDFHPFSSAFIAKVSARLNPDRMEEAAKLFLGKHDFKAFCKPSENKSDFRREVLSVGIFTSNEFLGTFFPKEIQYFEVTGTGFLHHQVRKMMTAIWEVGQGNWEYKAISDRLSYPQQLWDQVPPAPGHGLILWETILKPES